MVSITKYEWESELRPTILDTYTKNLSAKQVNYFLHKTSFKPNQIENYTIDQLYDFCMALRSTFRFYIIAGIILVRKLDTEILSQYINTFEAKYTSVMRSVQISQNIDLTNQPKEVVAVRNLVTNHCLNLLETSTDVQEIYTQLQDILKGVNMGRKIPICASILNSLNKQDLADELLQYFIDKKLPPFEIFRTETKWKTELVNELFPIITKRVEINSSYPETRINGAMNRIISYLRLFEKYIQEQLQTPTHFDSLQWFFGTCTLELLSEAFVFIGENYIEPLNHLVRSKISLHHAADFVKVMVPLFREYIPHYFMCKGELSLLKTVTLLQHITDKRERPVETRRSFFASELDKLLEYVKNDSKWTLIFLILKEVGLRAGAIGTLRIKNVVSPTGSFFDEITHLEKNRRTRTFIVSKLLKESFKGYCKFRHIDYAKDRDMYLFTNEKNENRLSKAAICVKLKDIALKCGIAGMHVHPHAFRHTIVNNLMACGNKLENVSKYMGHSSISTTETYYWTTELRNIVPTMNIPWLVTAKKNYAYPEDLSSDEEDIINDNNEDVKTISSNATCSTNFSNSDIMGIAIGLISAMQSVLTVEQKQTLKGRIPNIEQMFAVICEHSIASNQT